MKPNAAVIALAIALAAPGAARAQTPTADLILTNARVYTADAARPRAQAVAIRDGFAFIGMPFALTTGRVAIFSQTPNGWVRSGTLTMNQSFPGPARPISLPTVSSWSSTH